MEEVKDSTKISEDKIKHTTSDVKETFNDKKEDIQEKIKEDTNKAFGFFSGLGESIKDTTTKGMEEVKDSTKKSEDKIKHTASDVKETVHDKKEDIQEKIKEDTNKAFGFFSGLGESIKDATIKEVEHAKEMSQQSADTIKETAKTQTEKAGDVLTDLSKQIEVKADENKQKIAEGLQDAREKVHDQTSELGEKISGVKDTATEKTSGFFSGIGKMFKGTVDDATEAVVSTKDSVETIIEDTATTTKDVLKDTKDKSLDVISTAKETTKSLVHDADLTLQQTKDKLDHKIAQAKDSTTEKIDVKLEESKDKLQETVSDVKGNITETSIKTGDFIQHKVSDTKETLKDTVDDAKEKIQSSKEKTGGFLSGLGNQLKDTVIKTEKDIIKTATDAKEGVKDKTKKTSKTIEHSIGDSKAKVATAKDATIQKVEQKLQESTDNAGELLSGFGTKIKETSSNIKDTVKSAEKSTKDKIKTKETEIKESVKDKKEKVSHVVSGLGSKLDKTAHETKETIVSAKDSGIEKIKDTSSVVKTKVEESAETASERVDNLGQKIKQTTVDAKDSGIKKIKETSTILKEEIEVTKENIDELGTTIKDAGTEKLDQASSVIKETVDDISKMTKQSLPEKSKKKNKRNKKSGLNLDTAGKDTALPQKVLSPDSQMPGQASFTTKMSDYVCYVTTPTMQRRGIGGSQRLTKNERPAPLDVSNMPDDSSSDDDYIVTEPGDAQKKLRVDDRKNRASPALSETETLLEEMQETDLLEVEGKRRPLFHLGSRDEDSIELGERTDLSVLSPKLEIKTNESIKDDVKADIDLIENKLHELDKALGDLEKANEELDSTEVHVDDKTDRKLRRVERRFERMASETMEKDIKEAKENLISSPEVEAKREEDFRTMVSQLSQDEVSEAQRLYSTLWDEATFTPSEEWDSKTPDSQPDDIQDLPQETSGGPLTNLTTEGSIQLTTLDQSKLDHPTLIPRPKPRVDKTPDTQKPSDSIETKVDEKESTADETTETYFDKKKFWENVATTKKETETEKVSVKKRMSLFEEQLYKQPIQESQLVKKRTSVHEVVVPPVPKPRSTVLPHIPSEEPEEIVEAPIVSEYRSAFKDPSTIPEPITIQSTSITTVSPSKPQKSESLDSESEYLKYEHQAYENTGYQSDEHDDSLPHLEDKRESIPQIKRRQMSVSQPPVAATRKTIFERSVSLPTEDLQDVNESSVKARKQFFEQQIKNEMVIDQLMTQFEEEEPQEYKTLTDSDESKLDQPLPAEQKSKSANDFDKDMKDERLLTPISSSSSQDTRTEDDITQYTPTSVKDLTRYFQPPLPSDVSRTQKEHVSESGSVKSLAKEIAQQLEKKHTHEEDVSEEIVTVKETISSKRSSTESEQSISSERSIELGSADELVAEIMQYRSESNSKPSDSLEVHVDKSEIEDSEKITDYDPDRKSIDTLSDLIETEIKESTELTPEEMKIEEDRITESIAVENIIKERKIIEEAKEVKTDQRKLKDEQQIHEISSTTEIIKETTETDRQQIYEITSTTESLKEVKIETSIQHHEQHLPDTVWEVIESHPITEHAEPLIEMTVDRQDEELSGSVRDESDLGSEIHQDHSESYESERVRSESHSDIEQLILESLYHQKIHPEEARKIASELIDDIEAEVQRRNLLPSEEGDELPAPHPEVAKNQISDYLRQLAEAKGLDANEVELVESVLARKQNELSKLKRHDTQTSSMEITDEDLKYSGGECDISLSDTQENILDEQIEHLDFEFDAEKPNIDEEKFSEKTTDVSARDIHLQKDKEFYADDSVMSLKSETIGKVQSTVKDEKESVKKIERITDENESVSKEKEEKRVLKGEKDEIELKTELEIKGDNLIHSAKVLTNILDDEFIEHKEKSSSVKIITDVSDITKTRHEDLDSTHVSLAGKQDVIVKTQEEIEGGTIDTRKFETTSVSGTLKDESANTVEQSEEKYTTADGTEITNIEVKEQKHTSKVSTSQIVDHKREEKTYVTTIFEEISGPIITEIEDIKTVLSDESKSSPYESAKSPTDQVSSSSSARKDDSDTSHTFDKHEVIFRKTKLYKDLDTSSSSGNLRADRRSGTDYSSSGESYYQSFEQDSAKSRPCSSDVEGLMAAGSSEYESALTSQEMSSKSHRTSEYHTAVSSLSSQSMKSLDSESSGHMASVEVSEASETLVPSTFELEGDIIDGAVSQLLEDEIVDTQGVIEPYDREIPEHVIRGEYPAKEKISSFDTISDSEMQGESMDISEEDERPVVGETTFKMKRSQEMTFQPEPKAIIPDSPQSDTALEMDERFGTSLEDGSVLSMSLSSTTDAQSIRTVIETSRRDSDRMDGSITPEQLSFEDIGSRSRLDALSASNLSLDKTQVTTSGIDTATSTGTHTQDLTLSSVTITTSSIDENGTQSVSTQVTSKTSHDEVPNGPTQVDYVPEYDDVVETKKVRGHRRQESTSTFVPSMIPGFVARGKPTEIELTLKETHSNEMKDVDETEEIFETDEELELQREELQRLESESDIALDEDHSRPHSRISIHSDDQRASISVILSEDRPDSELLELMQQGSIDVFQEPIERPLSPEPREYEYEMRDDSVPPTPKEKQEMFQEKQMKISISEKSSIEEAEAEAAFSMVAHVSPAHRAKGDICPILEDEDAEKHELETRERAQKEMEERRALIKEQSPGAIPDIMVTEHMTPLIDRAFHYPDLELEEKEAQAQKSAPPTPGSITSKSSEETDQGREYILDDSHQIIAEEPELESTSEETRQMIESKSEISQSTIVERTVCEEDTKEADSPNSDSFEMLEKPDIIDDFVVIEEVAKEAAEHDSEGKSVEITQTKYIRKHDEEVEEYLVRSAPTPLTRMTDLKYYPDGTTSEDVGPFDFEDSPPQAGAKRSQGVKTDASRSYAFEYDKELEASKKWIEMQFQGDQTALINAGYGYEMEFERGPLEDIKEEEATDFESSRIGSLDSTKQSIGSLGSVKDSFSSTPEYDVLAGRKFFTRSGEHDDVSMSSLQEFESLERAISLENRKHHTGSQDSSSNGSSFSKRYHAGRSGQGDDISLSSLKEFEGLETACIEAHKIEIKAKEEEALLTQIDEAQESLISESESCKSISSADKKLIVDSEEEDYEKRMFEIDEIIKQAQSNVEKFIDMKDVVDKTESMGRGDSLEEVAKVPDLELDEPLVKSTVHTVTWGTEDVMQTSTDSLDLKPTHHASTDSLDMKTTAGDIMTTSTDSIEFQIQSRSGKDNIMTDSIEIHDPDRSCMITSDSLELTPGTNLAAQLSDSIDEDGSRIGDMIAHDHSISSGRGEDFSFGRDDHVDDQQLQDPREDYLLGSTDSLDPSSSTATHATYQYETDSVMSSSFTSGGSNTMVSSTDTIDPMYQGGVDLASGVKRVWFDDDSFAAGSHFTVELLDECSEPYVTEIIEPCEDDPEFSHTIHRKVELPPEVKKITFKGPDADLQLRQYIENFGEGEDVQETQEVDKDGNIHTKRVVQKRFVVKADESGQERRISGPEIESYLQQVSHKRDEYDLSYRDPSEFGLTKQTVTDSDGTKTVYGQKFTTSTTKFEGEETALKHLLSSIASDESSSYTEHTITRHVDNQQESSGASTSGPVTGTLKDETTGEAKSDSENTQGTPQRNVSDQHQLSSEMMELLAEMEKHSKH